MLAAALASNKTVQPMYLLMSECQGSDCKLGSMLSAKHIMEHNNFTFTWHLQLIHKFDNKYLQKHTPER